jgi:bifunctional DNase/RNase
MFNFQNGTGSAMPSNYAASKNSRFSMTQSQVKTIKQRWDETFNSLPPIQQRAINSSLQAAISEFQRRHPNIKGTKDLKKQLAKAWTVKMSQVCIDDTMQRQLNIAWVLTLLNLFVATKVIPIHVYQPDPNDELYLAWDGQHTLVLLWLIATQIFGEDPEDFEIPVNVYASHMKAEMRGCFIDLNSEEGKKMLDMFDKIEQMIYGVRVDKSTNPLWVAVEEKQQIVESHGLFLTSKKFGDDHMPGAISRMQEVNKLTKEPLTWLCTYLVAVGAQHRAVEEKEIVMMAYFFDRCRLAKLKLSTKQVLGIANLAKTHWGADFTPTGRFWARAGNAYRNWHSLHVMYGNPRFNKEPLHGYPFLAEQIKKDLAGFAALSSNTSSEFVPAQSDLY